LSDLQQYENVARSEPRTRTKYVYDASGTRVAKGALTSFSCNFSSNGYATGTSWVLGPGGEQVTEYSVSGSTSTWTHTNAFAGGKLLATYTGTDTYFHLTDWLGSRRVEIDAAGHCAATFANLPFGNTPNNGTTYQPGTLTGYSLCTDPTEHHFTGKERDTESGNDYFDARYYSSSMGRFMSPDWSAKEEPVPYAQLDDPQSLNLYAYVGNNPLNRVDADGHCGGQNDETPDCQNVTVEVTKKTDVIPVKTNAPIDGKIYSAEATQVTYTVKVDGQQATNMDVHEDNTTSLTVNGVPQGGPTYQQDYKSTDGTIPDVVGPAIATDGSKTQLQSATNQLTSNREVFTDKQTMTVTTQGCTCSFESTRTVSNVKKNGKLGSYKADVPKPKLVPKPTSPNP